MDYIKREDALSDAMCVGVSCQECPFLIHPVNGGCKIENYIKSIPAAAVVERKRGKWVELNPQNSDTCRLIRCSECGNGFIVGFNVPYEDWIEDRNFCFRCGTDMREVNE